LTQTLLDATILIFNFRLSERDIQRERVGERERKRERESRRSIVTRAKAVIEGGRGAAFEPSP